jgi:hypothetical protein
MRLSRLILIVLSGAVAFPSVLLSQAVPKEQANDARINKLLHQMTLEE